MFRGTVFTTDSHKGDIELLRAYSVRSARSAKPECKDSEKDEETGEQDSQ